jgi:hypothetical protein
MQVALGRRVHQPAAALKLRYWDSAPCHHYVMLHAAAGVLFLFIFILRYSCAAKGNLLALGGYKKGSGRVERLIYEMILKCKIQTLLHVWRWVKLNGGLA